MVNVWTVWDERLQASGRPGRVARELTDVELLNLLASEQPDRGHEKRILKEEAHRRLEHRPARHHGGLRPRAAPVEPTAPGLDAQAFSRLPTHGDHVDPF